jgi:uncharacterized protein
MLENIAIIIFIANLIVGILLGMSSIGGFLLPLFYVGFLQLPLRESLALSFFSFAVAGIVGSYAYWKSKNLDLKLALLISIGSVPGALIGVQLNFLIPEHFAKLIMYIFVLLSGLSLILKGKDKEKNNSPHNLKILENKISILFIGLITGAICALTGAGGPILVVPLLAALGLSIRVAVGVGLFNSIIIAIPSMYGYFQHSNMDDISILIIASLIGQLIGIITGTSLANIVKTNHLQNFVASITIVSVIYMIISSYI